MATSMLKIGFRICTDLVKCHITALPTCRVLHISACLPAYGAKWRLSQGLPINGSSYGVLTDLPDYSFVDGRPTPLSAKQRQRKEQNVALATKVVQLVNEMKFGKKNHQQRLQEEKDRREEIIRNKLKPKV